MNFKKISAMLLSCALVGTLFTGCGDSTSQTQQQETNIQIGMIKNLNVTEVMYSDIIKKVEENSGIDLLHHQFTFYDSLTMLKMGLESSSVKEISTYKCVADYLIAKDPNFEMAENHAGNKKLVDNFAFAMRATDTALKDSINAALESMKQDGTLEKLTQTYIKNLNMQEDPPAVEFENFDGAETIKVGITGDLPPMDLVLADGKPAGFNTALLSELGKHLQKNIEIVQIDSAARATALSSGKIDISFWAIVPINDVMPSNIDKPQGVELSTPYFQDEILHIELKK